MAQTQTQCTFMLSNIHFELAKISCDNRFCDYGEWDQGFCALLEEWKLIIRKNDGEREKNVQKLEFKKIGIN